jgi:hypothetical protein
MRLSGNKHVVGQFTSLLVAGWQVHHCSSSFLFWVLSGTDGF